MKPPFFMTKTFSVISLGCPRNLVDSDCIISEFEKKGFVFQEEAVGADTVIINTCSFIEDAKKESIDVILSLIDAKKRGEIKKIIVSGCLSERYKGSLKKELKEVDEFRGVLDFNVTFSKKASSKLIPKHYAYIKVSEGCRNRCSYCIIPYLKGPYKSRPIDLIIAETEYLIARGVKEIILVGQDTSLYGIDLYKKKRLKDLLIRLDKIPGRFWIRVLYVHPLNLNKDVIKIIKSSKHICKYIDLPIEHISEKILKKMGRRIKKKDILLLIEYIRKTIPEVALRTSLIVGFPGETKKDFEELTSFVEKTKFERLGIFRYSREEGTPAYKFKPQIEEKVKESRFNELMLLQKELAEDINKGFKDKIMNVLVEEMKEDGYYIARSEYDAPEVDGLVYVKGKNLKIGEFYKVRITDTYEYDLVGEHIESSE